MQGPCTVAEVQPELRAAAQKSKRVREGSAYRYAASWREQRVEASISPLDASLLA